MTRLFASTMLLFALSAGTAFAQAETYDLRFYAPGASAPTQTHSFDASLVTCDQTSPSGSATNPNLVVWDDPDVAGRVCTHAPGSGSVLFSLPTGNYEATLVAINIVGPSGESNRAPFGVVADVPTTPSGLRLLRR